MVSTAGSFGTVNLVGHLWARDHTPDEYIADERWVSDGTATGTVQAADVNSGGSSFPRDLAKTGQTVLFSADDGVHGRELWAVKTH